jgi:uncharacterized protein
MHWSLLASALLMGLVGGPHCVVMCGALCALQEKGQSQAEKVRFHAGRMAGYGVLGLFAAGSIQALGWSARQAVWLKPVWMGWHVLVIAWGMVLLLTARHPVWAQQASKRMWQNIRALPGMQERRPGLLGMLWALMPCGLLYSAVALATISDTIWLGGLVMLCFAAASGLWLYATPVLWRLLGRWREGWGQRLSGLMLVVASVWAIYMQYTVKGGLFCID